MKSVKAWAISIGISFLFSISMAVEAKVVAVCNVDQLICGTINSKQVQTGILPFHLTKNNIKQVEYLDFSSAFLDDREFDVALLPMEQAKNWIKNTDYLHYQLPFKNSLIEISVSESGAEKDYFVTPNTSCHEQTYMRDLDCISASSLFEKSLEGKAKIIAYQSQIDKFIPLGVNYDVIKKFRDLSYVLLINKNSPLIGLHLEKYIVNVEGFGPYQIMIMVLLLFLLAAGCLTGFIHVNGKIDEQSGCFSKKEFENRLKKTGNSERVVMLLDYNNFKKVNDKKGHQVGDKVIEQVSFELIKLLRSGDKIYRIGGDEFFIEFSNLLPKERIIQITQQIKQVGNKVAHDLNIEDVNFGISVGAANSKGNLQAAYKEADDAMYVHKIKEKNLLERP